MDRKTSNPAAATTTEMSLVDLILEATPATVTPIPAESAEDLLRAQLAAQLARANALEARLAATPDPTPESVNPFDLDPVQATWAKVGSVWGFRAVGGVEGQRAIVTSNGGRVSRFVLGANLGGNVFAKIGAVSRVGGSKRKAKRTRSRVCSGNNNCRNYGWKKGRNCA